MCVLVILKPNLSYFRLDSDLFDIMYAVSTGTLDQVNVKWKEEHVACLVLASWWISR